MTWTSDAQVGDVEELQDDGPAASRIPSTTSAIETRDNGCQVGSGWTSNWTATSPESAALSSRIRPSRVRSRSTVDANHRQRIG